MQADTVTQAGRGPFLGAAAACYPALLRHCTPTWLLSPGARAREEDPRQHHRPAGGADHSPPFQGLRAQAWYAGCAEHAAGEAGSPPPCSQAGWPRLAAPSAAPRCHPVHLLARVDPSAQRSQRHSCLSRPCPRHRCGGLRREARRALHRAGARPAPCARAVENRQVLTACHQGMGRAGFG